MQLFEALRAWRARVSRARGVPAYVVFPDAALAAIAAARPATEEELLAVKGVGPRKLEEHGADVLAVVRGAF
jgi:superfamily II DNA helicase RecQ